MRGLFFCPPVYIPSPLPLANRPTIPLQAISTPTRYPTIPPPLSPPSTPLSRRHTPSLSPMHSLPNPQSSPPPLTLPPRTRPPRLSPRHKQQYLPFPVP